MGQAYSSKKNTRWIYLIIIMGLVYLWHGYQFGRADQIEWLPYSLYLSNHHVYPSDLYINYISDQWPNERWALSILISWFVPYEVFASFIFHLIFFSILTSGLWKVAGLWLRSPIERGLAILLLLILLQRTDLGGNEIYYNYLVSSLPAKAMGIWAIWFMYQRKYLRGVAILALTTLFQSLVGIQLVLLLGCASIIRDLVRSRPVAPLFYSFILYLGLSGWWIIGMIKSSQSAASLSFFELIRFRVPHHFIPDTFASTDYFIFAIMLIAVFVWLRKTKEVFIGVFVISILIGCLFYTFGVLGLESEIILKSQWFKTTLWLEIWVSISFISIFFELANKIGLQQRTIVYLACLMIVGAVLFSLAKRDVRYDFPFVMSLDEEVQIARQAQDLTDPTDVFILPFNNSTFRYWSQRNVYVDFKTVLHSPDYLDAWFKRIGEIYGLSKQEYISTHQKSIKANEYYMNLNAENLKRTSANYILTNKDHQLDLETLIKNSEWIVYKIR